MKKMNIGIAGTRGIPNAYGGFEQFAQYLSEALVKKGHEVAVYNSSLNPYQQPEWRGVKIITCRDWEDRLGTAGQFLYDRNCIQDAHKRNFDILLHLGYTSSSIWHRNWPRQTVHIVNMDGLEWRRPKYSSITRRFLKKAEAWAAKHADHLVADSIPIRDYLLKTYDRQATYIPYAADAFNNGDPEILKQYALLPNQYYLVIARMEPDNHIGTIIRGWEESKSELPLVIIGNPKNSYGKYLVKHHASNKLHFIGGLYDMTALNNLRFYSKGYFHGHSAGGTNPSLLEAIACRCSIAAHDNVFNRAVMGENADYFSNADHVSEIINTVPDEKLVQQRQEQNIKR